jgi:hypothetical protein
MQIKVWVVFERRAGIDHVVGARLTLDTAQALAKQAGNRFWRKMVATKGQGPGEFDTQL